MMKLSKNSLFYCIYLVLEEKRNLQRGEIHLSDGVKYVRLARKDWGCKHGRDRHAAYKASRRLVG